ncbi:hypothetical protein G6F22_016035 [Rhizopus arrhizus]|nr:hypothetical protein G6F22_016035 [Rhizopus arrhizus]KAG1197577.1 hypothetical protein G6F35_012787 [Rhizopus arrhizus]
MTPVTSSDHRIGQRPHPCKHRCALVVVDRRALQIGGDHPRWAARMRPQHGDVVARVITVAAGLVAHPPALAQPGAQAGIAGLVVDQPIGELLARCRLQAIAHREAGQAGGHRGRAGGIARVSLREQIHVRLVAVIAGNAVALPAQECRQRLRPAHHVQQQVGRGVVAGGQRAPAQVAHRQVLAHMAACHRGVGQQILPGDGYAGIERNAA